MKFENLCSDEHCWCRVHPPVYVNVKIPNWAIKDIVENGFTNINTLNTIYSAFDGKYDVN